MAYYDGCISVDLSAIKPMIALPFHPSNVYEIDTLNQNLTDILREIEIESERVAHGKAKLAAGQSGKWSPESAAGDYRGLFWR